MKKHTLYCNPADGQFNWEKLFDLKNLPAKLGKYKRVKVTFEKYVQKKSQPQLAYVHGVVIKYLEKEMYSDTGMSFEDWKYELKERFGVKEKDRSGTFNRLKSFADYTEPEMSLFIQQCIDWARDFFSLHVPPPEVIGDYI